MTRTPAPADDAHLDLALREAAEQWRLDFEVPPMPLLDSGSPPLDTPAPARQRWTRPVLVAASIIALGAVAAVVISSARPTNRAVGSPSSTASSHPSVTATQRLRTWPESEYGGLVIEVGSPPASITLGGSTMAMRSTGAPPWVVIDSERPNFLRILGSRDLGGECGSATRLFLTQSAPGTVTVTRASYRPELEGQVCPAVAQITRPVDGEAPFPVAGKSLIAGTTGAPVPSIDLADYPAPQYVPQGFTLGEWVDVAPDNGSSDTFRISRNLAPSGSPTINGINLTWQDLTTENVIPAARPSWSQVSICATRRLPGGVSVRACDVSADRQQSVDPTELQRVVDSIPS